MEDATGQGLAFFDFFIVGAIVTVFGLIVIMLSAKLLPEGSIVPMDINQYLIEAKVLPDSSLIGKSILENKLRDLDELFLVEIVRGNHIVSPVAPSEFIGAGDVLIFSGDINLINTLESYH